MNFYIFGKWYITTFFIVYYDSFKCPSKDARKILMQKRAFLFFGKWSIIMILHARSLLRFYQVNLVPKGPLKIIYRPKYAFLMLIGKWSITKFFHANSLLQLLQMYVSLERS